MAYLSSLQSAEQNLVQSPSYEWKELGKPWALKPYERYEYQLAIENPTASNNNVWEIWPAAKPKSLILGTYHPLAGATVGRL